MTRFSSLRERVWSLARPPVSLWEMVWNLARHPVSLWERVWSLARPPVSRSRGTETDPSVLQPSGQVTPGQLVLWILGIFRVKMYERERESEREKYKL